MGVYATLDATLRWMKDEPVNDEPRRPRLGFLF
jgi:hypothetical protein